jgi:hypothetical protein
VKDGGLLGEKRANIIHNDMRCLINLGFSDAWTYCTLSF